MRNTRNLFITLFVLIAALTRVACADTANVGKYDDANKLYIAGKYDDAKKQYEDLAKSGPLSANLFYNLGNAEWKLGNGGEAVADYERALTLEPGHPEARANLDFVRNETGAKVATPLWWEKALTVLNANAATILLATCAWVALFCLAAILIKREGRAGLAFTFVFCLLASGYAGGCIWMSNSLSTKAVVIAKSAQARVAPADVAPVQDTLPAGTEVLAPEDRGGWTYCTLPDGKRAWVPTEALERVNQT